MGENDDLQKLLADLRSKGYRASQLDVVGNQWDDACRAGAHPDLAQAAHALGDLQESEQGDPTAP